MLHWALASRRLSFLIVNQALEGPPVPVPRVQVEVPRVGVQAPRVRVRASQYAAALACLLASAVCAFAQVLAPSPLRPGEGQPADRVALVIGNSAYEFTAQIPTAVDDAAAVAASLRRLGFAVSELRNADYDKTRRALISFGDLARRSQTAIVYFAGHGLELDSENWLVPVDAQLQTDTDVEIGATSLRTLTAAVSGATQLGLVILDACRGNPFAATMQLSRRTRALQRGLARVEPDDNILVAFAARPGTTAIDPAGPHSAFTQALLNNIEEQGLEISYLFRNVHDDVLEATGEVQEPAYYGSLSENEIYLKPPPAIPAKVDVPAAPPPPATVVPAASPTADEITWFFLRDSTDMATLRLFLERFPNSPRRAEASALIASRASAVTPSPMQLASSADQIAWSMLRENPNGPGMRRFLESFPESPYAAEAQKLIATLEAQAKSTDGDAAAKRSIVHQISHNDPRIAEAWHIIHTSRDPNVLKNFAAELPSRQYASAVNARLAELGFDQGVKRLPPREAAELSVSQCDRLANDEIGFSHVSRDAVDACRRAIAVHPDIPRLQFQLCRCLFKIKQPAEANEHCNNAVQLAVASGDPNSANFYRANKIALEVAVAPTIGDPRSDSSSGTGGQNLNPNPDVMLKFEKSSRNTQYDFTAAFLAKPDSSLGTGGSNPNSNPDVTPKLDKSFRKYTLTRVDTKSGGMTKILTTNSTPGNRFKNTEKITSVSTDNVKTHSFKTHTTAMPTMKNVVVNTSSPRNAVVNATTVKTDVRAVKVTTPNVKGATANVKVSTPAVHAPIVKTPTVSVPAFRMPTFTFRPPMVRVP